jgi:hypothetical protein
MRARTSTSCAGWNTGSLSETALTARSARALPPRPAPVVADQVRCDHVEVALRVLQRRPPGEQPGERFGRDLVCGVVVIHQPAHPAGEAGVAGVEQFLCRCPVGGAELAHGITSGDGPRRSAPRAQQRRGAATRRDDGVGGLGLHRLYHTFCRQAGSPGTPCRCPALLRRFCGRNGWPGPAGIPVRSCSRRVAPGSGTGRPAGRAGRSAVCGPG